MLQHIHVWKICNISCVPLQHPCNHIQYVPKSLPSSPYHLVIRLQLYCLLICLLSFTVQFKAHVGSSRARMALHPARLEFEHQARII
jgi:hypothetical protein